MIIEFDLKSVLTICDAFYGAKYYLMGNLKRCIATMLEKEQPKF